MEMEKKRKKKKLLEITNETKVIRYPCDIHMCI